jgi:dihydroorotase
MSKFLAMGMALPEVLRLTTVAPADTLRRPDLGRLAVGGEADVAVFRLAAGTVRFEDINNRHREGKVAFQHVLTICRGEVLSTFEDGRQEGRKSSWQGRFHDPAEGSENQDRRN